MTMAETLVLDIALDMLDPGPGNARRVTRKIDELADSLKEVGYLQALLVRPNGDGSYYVVDGKRRLLAGRQAGLTSAPCLVRELDSDAEVVDSLVANVNREDNTVIERAEAMAAMRAAGRTQTDIGKVCGLKQAAVSRYIAVSTLPDEAKDRMDLDPKLPTGESDPRHITFTDGYELSKLVKHPAELEKCLKHTGAKPLSTVIAEKVKEITRAAEVAKVEEQLHDEHRIGAIPWPARWDDERPLAGQGYFAAITLTEEEHRDQRCHLATVNPVNLEVVWICTDPDSHVATQPTLDDDDTRDGEQLSIPDERRAARSAGMAAPIRRFDPAKPSPHVFDPGTGATDPDVCWRCKGGRDDAIHQRPAEPIDKHPFVDNGLAECAECLHTAGAPYHWEDAPFSSRPIGCDEVDDEDPTAEPQELDPNEAERWAATKSLLMAAPQHHRDIIGGYLRIAEMADTQAIALAFELLELDLDSTDALVALLDSNAREASRTTFAMDLATCEHQTRALLTGALDMTGGAREWIVGTYLETLANVVDYRPVGLELELVDADNVDDVVTAGIPEESAPRDEVTG